MKGWPRFLSLAFDIPTGFQAMRGKMKQGYFLILRGARPCLFRTALSPLSQTFAFSHPILIPKLRPEGSGRFRGKENEVVLFRCSRCRSGALRTLLRRKKLPHFPTFLPFSFLSCGKLKSLRKVHCHKGWGGGQKTQKAASLKCIIKPLCRSSVCVGVWRNVIIY